MQPGMNHGAHRHLSPHALGTREMDFAAVHKRTQLSLSQVPDYFHCLSLSATSSLRKAPSLSLPGKPQTQVILQQPARGEGLTPAEP